MVKVAIIGLGGMGQVHLENYKHIGNCEVAAAADPFNKETLESQHEISIYETVEALLQNESVDLIDICTPTFMHYDHAKVALAAGINTLIEKPVTLHLKEAEELYELAESNGCHLYVGQVLRFTKPYRHLKDVVDSMKYGKPLQAFFNRLSTVPKWSAGGWLLDGSKSGQLIYDLHIHDLDMIVSIFGEPSRTIATGSGCKERPYTEHYSVHYEYPNLNVFAEAAWYSVAFPFTATWRVYFEHALMVFDGETLTLYEDNHPPMELDVAMDSPIATNINLPPTDMFFNELEHFVSCVNESKSSDVVRKNEILTVLNILETIVFS